MVSIANLIKQEPRWSIVVGDQQICIAIVINITGGYAATDFEQRKLRSRLGAHFDETSLSGIAKKLVRFAQRERIFLAYQVRQQLNSSVGDKQIEPAIVVIIKEESAKTREATPRHSQAGFASTILEESLAQVNVECVGLIHQVSHKDVFGAVAIDVACIDAHTGFGLSVSVDRSSSQQCVVYKRAVLLVDPELVGIAIVRYINIDPAIVVEVRSDDSQSVAEFFVDTRGDSYIFKDSVAFVVKEPVARRTKDTRRAIVSRSCGGVAVRAIRNGKIGIVHDHQIEPAVVIVVEERCACAPAWIIGPTLFGYIDKLSATFVQVHLIGTEIREVEIR